MARLEFGLFDTLSRGATNRDTAALFDHHIGIAKMAENLGYGYYFFIEHQNAYFQVVSAPTVYLGALARETKKIHIGAMIFQVPLHHPVRLAQDTALVDQLSHGRLEFAIGYGTRNGEFAPWGMNYGERRPMGVEAIEIMLKAWTQKKFDHDGKYWQIKGATPQPQVYQKPHPRVWMGGHSQESFDYAAKNNFHLAQNMDVERLIAEKFDYFRQAWKKQNHPGPMPKTLCVRNIHVAETDALAREEAEQYMLRGLIGKAGVQRALNLSPEDAASASTVEICRVYLETSKSYDFWLDEGLAFIGSPETVMKQIRAQQKRCGYDILLLNHTFEDMPDELITKSIRLCGETVLRDYNREAVPA